MKRSISLMLVFIIISALFACGRRNGDGAQDPALQQTSAAATLRAMVAQGGGQQPVEGGQQPVEGGQQPVEGGQQPVEGGQQPVEGGQQPVEGGQQPPEPPHPSGDQADLVVGKIKLSDTTPSANQTIQVQVTITNRGPGIAKNFQWGVIPTYEHGGPNNPVTGETIAVLNPATQKIYAVDIVYPAAGGYTLMAAVDLNNAVNDPDRNNNQQDLSLIVDSGVGVAPNTKPTADLKITNVTASKLTPAVNEEIKISATVFNAGPDPVKNLNWAIYPAYQENSPFQQVLKGTIAQLNPNDDTFIEATTKYSEAGKYTAKIVADLDNKVDDPHPGGGEIKIKVNPFVPLPPQAGGPPAPTGCWAELVSSDVARVHFEAPAAEQGEYEGFKVYEVTKGLMTTISDCCAVYIMALRPNIRYIFYVVTYQGALESEQDCVTYIETPAQ